MKRIILVEDDDAIRDVFSVVFKNSEYSLINLDRGDAVVSGEIESPDLFILDKSISGMNGLDLCRFIKASEVYGSIPVIMLSASPDIATLAKDVGANDSISKPFSLKKLRETVATYLR